MEQLDYNMLFRWFVGLAMDAPVWDVTVFTKNRDRLLEGDIARGVPGRDAGRSAGQGAAVGRAFLGRRHADRGLGVDEELPPEGRQRRAARRRAATPSATSTARSAATRRTPRPPIRTRGSTARRAGQAVEALPHGPCADGEPQRPGGGCRHHARHRHGRARGGRGDDRRPAPRGAADHAGRRQGLRHRRTSSPRCARRA